VYENPWKGRLFKAASCVISPDRLASLDFSDPFCSLLRIEVWNMQIPMTNPSDREVTIFNAALDLGEELRAGYLEQVCAGDNALRLRIEALLRMQPEAGTFLENPGLPDLVTAAAVEHYGPSGTVRLTLSSIEKTGDRIGRYKLLQQIGEGGCGVVYMAEQSEPVRRKVAVKVIKLGMDTKNVIARFEAERQALALMDHPNIAKVLDAGATEAGRPFFVMELVKGVRITEYCDQNNLATKARLKLFTQVCHAIQHAHQKGIIHRDIKPSNILVTMHDGVPVPKVIDFGIAKATTDQPLTDKTLFTAFEQFIGTPAYMSPEQAEMTGLDIDTRTDIYALGVLLYELLTGRTPFDPRELLASGLEAMRRTIREQEPDRPSTALSTMVAADLTDVAKHRQTEAPGLVHMLRGDLDWIVMKALEKDRTRRYETANGLAMDVQRHLSNEPVVARPPNSLYRFQKLVRRNKVAFIATSAVTVAVLVALALSTWLLVKETAARRRAVAAEQAQERMRREADSARREEENLRLQAETEAVKSRQVAQLLENMLRGVGPSVALGRDTVLLREILDNTAKRVGDELKRQPGVEGELTYTLGEAYFELGEFAQAELMHRRALELRKRLNGEADQTTALSMSHLGRVLLARRQLVEAESLLREALAVQRKLPGQEPADTSFTLTELSVALNAQGGTAQRKEAEALLGESLVSQRKRLGEESVAVADTLEHLAAVLQIEGKVGEAEEACRGALAIRRKFPADQIGLAGSLVLLTRTLQLQRRLGEAEIAGREALAVQRKLYPPDHPALAASLDSLGYVLLSAGKSGDAESFLREAVRIRKAMPNNDDASVGLSLYRLALTLGAERKFTEAEPIIRESLARYRKVAPKYDLQLSGCCYFLGVWLFEQGKLEEAESTLREAVAIRKKRKDKEAQAPDSIYYLSRVLQAQGKLTEGEALCRETLAQLHAASTNDSAIVAQILGCLAENLAAQRKPGEAEQALREATAIMRRLVKQEPGMRTQRSDLGHLLWQLGQRLRDSSRPTEARSVYEESLQVFEAAASAYPEDPYFRQEQGYTHRLLAELANGSGQTDEVERQYRAAIGFYAALATNAPGNDLYLMEEAYNTWMLASVLEHAGRFTAAAVEYRHGIVLDEKGLTTFPARKNEVQSRLSSARVSLAKLLRAQGKNAEAEALEPNGAKQSPPTPKTS
jgi:serine/threonine protein kinase/tetratricopeptide (TPR) repeat protein